MKQGRRIMPGRGENAFSWQQKLVTIALNSVTSGVTGAGTERGTKPVFHAIS
jgi:hypothetical protein